MPIIITVAIIDGNKSSDFASPAIIVMANCIPNIEWIIAKINGNPKNIAIWLNFLFKK